MTAPLITLTTDFGTQSQGIGIMEAVAFKICPSAKLIHFMHGLPEYNITAAARTMECLRYVPTGIHVCVCDPGVGTRRRPILLQTGRGDYLIGPDNGVLLPAARILKGITAAYEIANPRYMQQPVSPLFHGRDIFMPAAAHLASGVEVEQLAVPIAQDTLVPPPYTEAVRRGDTIDARILQINRFGSLHVNVLHELWDSMQLSLGARVEVVLVGGTRVDVTYARTFGDVAIGDPVVLKDDYGRVELAVNQGSFAAEYGGAIGEAALIIPLR